MSQQTNTEPLLDMTINAVLALFRRVYPVSPPGGLIFTQLPIPNGQVGEMTWVVEVRNVAGGAIAVLPGVQGSGPTVHAAVCNLLAQLNEKVKTRKIEDEKALTQVDRVIGLLQAPAVASVAKV